MITLKELKESIGDGAKEGTPEFDAALIMLAAIHVGQTYKAIEELTGLDRITIKRVRDRLERNKIWRHGKTFCDWFDKEGGGTAFWMDVCVAIGMMERT